MKILSLSLLRLGDLLMHRRLFQEMKRRWPKAELHVLYHSQFRQIEELIPEVDVWHALPYQELQKTLVENQHNTMLAYHQFSQIMNHLDQQNFDVIYNLTHSFLSARIMDLISAPVKKGIAYRNGRREPITNQWLNYLNDIYSESGDQAFHYIEALAKSLDLPVPAAKTAQSRNSNKVLFQVTSSDEKKSWPLLEWKNFIQDFKNKNPKAHLAVLSSKHEFDLLQKVFADLVTVKVCSMKEAQNLLKEASLLVSLDTSLVHLAANEGCPVLGIYLGCARASKTAPYLLGAEIIQSDRTDLSLQEMNQSPRFKTTQAGYFSLVAISGGNAMKQQISQSTWSFYLNEDYLSPVPPYGTAAKLLVDEVAVDKAEKKKAIRALEDELIMAARVESYMDRLEGEISHISRLCLSQSESTFSEIEKTQRNLQSFISQLQEQFPERKDEFVRLKQVTENKAETAFSFFKHIKSAFSEALHLNMIRARLVQTAIRELTQKGEVHVPEFR